MMKTKRGQKGRGPARKVRSRTRPNLEALDQRLLLTVYTVTNTLDSGDGSLRAAITSSNADTAQANEIDFDITPPGLAVITPLASSGALPTITQAVVINGTTQPQLDPTAPASGPLIEIDGSQVGAIPAELTVATNGVTIEGIDFQHLGGAAISLSSVGSDVVQGNYIGIDPTGTMSGGNTGQNGILVTSASNTIGGTTAAARNVIADFPIGVELATGATFSVVQGNYIGTNAAGTSALTATTPGNGVDTNSSQNTIGGFAAGSGNVISGWQYGINLNNSALNTIVGNFIGTDESGNIGIGNSLDGIYVGGSTGSAQNTIGARDPSQGSDANPVVVGNVISDNARNGITVTEFSPFTRIQGNKIGVGANGAASLGNGNNGILLNGQTSALVGLATLTGNGTNTETPFGNVITNNGTKSPLSSPAAGILVSGGSNNGILTNSIYNNAGLGIQLSRVSQPTSAPTISSALSGGSQTRIAGTIVEQPLTTYRIQLFASTSGKAGNGQTFIDEFDVTTDSSGNGSLDTTIGVAVPVGQYLTATATQNAASNPSTSAFSAPVQVGQAIVSDLGITQTAQSGNPLVGQPYSYTVVVVNSGQDAATGVTIMDTLPANSTLVSTSLGTLSNGVLTIDVGDLAIAQTMTYVITVKPTTTTNAFTNTASVSGDNIDPNPANNTTTPLTETVLADADLAVVLTPATNPTAIGTPLTFIMTVTNEGPSTANNVITTVTLPADYSNITAAPDQGTFSVSGNVLTISSGILPSSGSSSVTFTATPGVAGTESTTATVSNPGLNGGPALADPNTANNTVTVPVTAANAADLALDISAAPDPVLVGNTLFYTITITNNGPSDATDPILTDALPSSVTYDPSQSSDQGGGTLSFANGTVTATLGTITAGGTDVVTIAVTPSVSGALANSATVSDTNEIDSDLTNNTASTSTSVSPADIQVTIENPADPLLINNQYFYQVTVQNLGPADATNVELTDVINGVGSFGSSAPGTVNGTTLTDNIGTLSSGFQATVLIPVIPGASGPLLNTASVTSDEFDPNQNNNTATVSNLVNPVDLSVAVTGSPSSVQVGSNATFTVTVTNNGTTQANNVIFTQAIPSDSTFVSAGSSQGSVALSGSTLSGNVGSLAPGASLTVTIVITPTTVATITDTATVTSDGYEVNPGDNTGSGSIAGTNQPGSFAFASGLELVPENAGTVSIPVTRTDGSLGAVTLTYATSDYTGVSGVNYVGTTGTVSFADGQTTAIITISVLDDGIVNGATGFFVTLSNPTGGGILAQPNVTAVLVTNTDRDTIPPVVTSFTGIPNGSSLNGFIVGFSEEMDPARASDVSNYHIFLSTAKGEVAVPLAAALYNPLNDTVTLVPTAVLPGNKFYHVVINGSFGDALTDLSGNVLYGTSGPNSNYNIFYGRGSSLTYVDSHQNSVNINISGGTLDIVRGANGDAASVTILGATAGKSKLTGSVKKLTRASSGHTTIGAIIGLGSFGAIKSSLTTPGFYVISAPVSTNTTTVSAAAISTSIAKKTPKGPASS